MSIVCKLIGHWENVVKKNGEFILECINCGNRRKKFIISEVK